MCCAVAVEPVNAPHIDFDQRFIRQIPDNLLSVFQIGNLLDFITCRPKVFGLVRILPQQFTRCHFALIQLPDRRPQGQQSHEEHQPRFAVVSHHIEVDEGLLEKDQ